MVDAIRAFFERLFAAFQGRRSETVDIQNTPVNSVHPRVLLVVYDPIIPHEGSRRLSKVLNWNDAGNLAQRYISDLQHASYGYCNYEVVERLNLDKLPVKTDGFSYTPEAFISAWRAGSGFHQPDSADYHQILSEHNLVERIYHREIDEVWLFAPPYAGFYESRMVGPGAFWCNSSPLEGYDQATRRFVVMGFNYERGVGEMLESFGHRAESIMSHAFRKHHQDANLWERFIRYELTHPGKAEVGNVHFAPNSEKDYDWGNNNIVLSYCDNWHNFPDHSGEPRLVNSSEWGNGDIRLHHLWWLRHLPHIAGTTGSLSHNWWEYIVDPEQVR